MKSLCVCVCYSLTRGSLASMLALKCCRLSESRGSTMQTSGPAESRKTVRAVRRHLWSTTLSPKNTHTDIYKHTVNIQTYFHSFHKIEVHSVCSSVVLPASHRCSSVFRADLSSILQAPPLFSCRLIGDVSTNFRAWRTACSTRPRPAVSPGPGSRNVYLFAGYYKKNKNVFVCVCVLPLCVLGWWTTSLRTPSNR